VVENESRWQEWNWDFMKNKIAYNVQLRVQTQEEIPEQGVTTGPESGRAALGSFLPALQFQWTLKLCTM
jgi:hypothetical protein